MKFDIVYTWVNGNDPNYLKTRDSYAKIKKDINPERYRDDFEVLKYSLRSLETYFNSFNHIYLLTARPQVPDWLNSEHERITIVHHDEVIPTEYLPTFNSNVIESFLHRIPGLSENFIYMNDDFLFGKLVTFDMFYKDSKYKIYNTFFGENLGWRIYDGYNDLIGLGLIEHHPILINKQFWENAFELYPNKTEKTRNSRFRDRTNFFPLKLYRFYMLKYQRQLSAPVFITEALKVSRFQRLTNDLKQQSRFFEKIKHNTPVSYCINDDLGETPNPKVVALMKEFLDKKYPTPSTFEL